MTFIENTRNLSHLKHRDLVHKELIPSVRNPFDVHYNVAYKLSSFIRKEIMQMHAKTINDDVNVKLQTIPQKQFQESEAGRGKIRYQGGWCLSSLRRMRMKRIMANAYNGVFLKLKTHW